MWMINSSKKGKGYLEIKRNLRRESSNEKLCQKEIFCKKDLFINEETLINIA